MKNHIEPVTIYLAGYISGEVITQCVAWRKKIVDYYENWKGNQDYPIIFLDPLNSKDYEKISKDGTTAEGIDSNAIIHRDYQCVMKSDLIIVNLDTFGMSRVPFGTIAECAWAWDKRKPIILISEDEVYHRHPFSRYFASCIVKNVDELLERKLINYFFKGWNSVQYE
jgi:hypothetical protein